MSNPVRFALFGTGRIGQVHATNIASRSDAVMQWICDPFLDGATTTADRVGGRVTADPAEVFAAGDVDAIVLASPTPTHVDLIEAAIDAGIPVLCEKPIDLDIGRVDSLRARAIAAGIPVALGFNRRFDPHFADLHRRVEAGEIGTLEHLSITSRDPAEPPAAYVSVSGGIFRDMTIHDFDMARFFLPDITEVFAMGTNQFSRAIQAADDWDAATVLMKAAGGQTVTITNSRHSAYGYDQRLEAFGSEGLLQVNNVGPTVVRRFTAESVETLSPYYDFFLERYAVAYQDELTAFVDAVHGRDSSSPTYEDGRAALLLADAAAESAKTGRSIRVALSE
jgi:myo-inositol 2-dehydrogenase/D-chiro-inositol 1-dehydrogenase